MLRVLLALAAACSPTTMQHGVPNLAQVDANVWRSGQIATAEGWNYVAELAAGRKIHVVKLNFEAEGSDKVAVDRGWDVHYLPIQPEGDVGVWDDVENAWKRPDARVVATIDQVLAAASSTGATDFYLVHCTHGQDRTGFVIGRHRVLHEGWTKSRAWREMLEHHFHWELHGIADAWEDWTTP